MPIIYDPDDEESNTNDSFPQGDTPDGKGLFIYFVAVVVAVWLLWVLL